MTARRAAAALLCAALAALPAAAQDGTATLDSALLASQALTDAAAGLTAAGGARDRIAALTEVVRAYEQGLAALRASLRQAQRREADIRTAFEARQTEIARLVGTLAGIERASGPLLLLHPSGPLATARAGMIGADVTPALQAQAARLAAELDELHRLRRVQDEALAALQSGLAGAQTARTALSTALGERRELPERMPEDPEALAAVLAAARTLEDFAAAFAALPLAPGVPETDFRALRGEVPLPADALLLRGFGEPDSAGVARPGLLLATEPLALVSAPAAATVRFVGPLQDYGNVIILEPQSGYLIVLAGLGEVYARTGEIVAAAAPLGLMGGAQPHASEFLALTQQGGGGDRTETLYMELRVGGAPVNPEQWFALGRG